MNKALKTGLQIGALVLGGIVTLMNTKVSNAEMKSEIAKEVNKAMKNQAKES